MKLLKRKSVEDVAEDYKRQYGSNSLWWDTPSFSNNKLTGEQIYNQILGCRDTAQIIESRILPSGWVTYKCDLCGDSVYTIIDTEHTNEYDDNILVCHACILEMNTAWKEGHQ